MVEEKEKGPSVCLSSLAKCRSVTPISPSIIFFILV